MSSLQQAFYPDPRVGVRSSARLQKALPNPLEGVPAADSAEGNGALNLNLVMTPPPGRGEPGQSRAWVSRRTRVCKNIAGRTPIGEARSLRGTRRALPPLLA